MRSILRIRLAPAIAYSIAALCTTVLLFSGLLTFHQPSRDSLLPSSWTTSSQPKASPSLPLLPASFYETHFPNRTLPDALLHPSLDLLASRLSEFLHRPILSYDESIEYNQEHCPLPVSDALVNPDQLRGEGQFWRENVGVEKIAQMRAGIIKLLEERIKEGFQVVGSDSMSGGRGIVVAGGNQDTTLRLITVLRHLRRLNNTLPIELFHFPRELTDEVQRETIRGLGASIREISGVQKSPGAWKNFQIKGLAITQSSFREVLYLDSDNIPLRNPSHLFNSPIYLDDDTRAVFWPDLSKDHATNAIWRLIGDQCTLDHWTFESGQIVIDKAGNHGLNLAALWIASGMMGSGPDGRDFWFHMCGGDKDTFRWAFRVLRLNWGSPPRWMSALGGLSEMANRFCGHTTLQYDLVIPKGFTQPPPLFVHSNLLKHLGKSGITLGNTFTHVKRMSLDRYSEPSLNFAHLWVYWGNIRGMCLDFELHPAAATEFTDEEKRTQFVETIEVGDLEGQPFEGFEEAFWEEGGRVGGW
ncbi:hypothetical protein FRB96_000796 [Tulasnella sp. 330]|nr:hypothetical protein FRB96_000796 [Tulasnella sp. 330]KAG8882515.1 hypothetical protein FRB97_008141 [Tulasnella sp. 331]KAG8888849.1 hypothetical protein FRB98_006635 [Tulasnella sp. 332]